MVSCNIFLKSAKFSNSSKLSVENSSFETRIACMRFWRTNHSTHLRTRQNSTRLDTRRQCSWRFLDSTNTWRICTCSCCTWLPATSRNQVWRADHWTWWVWTTAASTDHRGTTWRIWTATTACRDHNTSCRIRSTASDHYNRGTHSTANPSTYHPRTRNNHISALSTQAISRTSRVTLWWTFGNFQGSNWRFSAGCNSSAEKVFLTFNIERNSHTWIRRK